jgi:flagellar biosynthesis/type III secretory pathway M-ring protein FliF/YscJ
MVIIGLVLIAAAAAVGIEITAMNNVSIDIDAFNQLYETSAAVVFVAGAVTALAGAIGIMLVRDGLIRRREARRERALEEELRQRHITALEQEHAAHQRAELADGNNERVDLREPVGERDREPDHVTAF